jgi:DNA mismatch repair protein MutL
MLAQAIQDGFQPFLTPRRHPLVLLFLQVPPDEVDANVHPTKTEIRFANGNGIFSLVKNSIAKAVREFQVPVYSYAREEKSDTSGGGEVYETPLLYDMSTGEVIEERRQTGPSLFPPEQSSRYQERSSRYLAEAEPLREGSPAETSRQTSFLPLAQLFDTYIIGEMKGELWIADQHASHERVVYDRLLKPSGEQGKAAQTLLISEVMEFSPSESLLLSEHIQTFNDMGFSLEHFGGNSFVLRSLPPFIEPGQAGELIRSILADISQGAGGKGKEGHDLFDGLRKIISCRGSVQAGQRMTPEEMKRLIYDLLNCGDPWHCPHGRPTMVKLGKLDLEKMFKRK